MSLLEFTPSMDQKLLKTVAASQNRSRAGRNYLNYTEMKKAFNIFRSKLPDNIMKEVNISYEELDTLYRNITNAYRDTFKTWTICRSCHKVLYNRKIRSDVKTRHFTDMPCNLCGHKAYGSALYATPELAITAKVMTIMESKIERIREAKELLSNIEKNTAKYEELYNITMNEHPEYFI